MKNWNLQLVSPSGEIFELGGLGYASSGIEHSYVMPEIRAFLPESNLTQREFLLADLHQMLLNPNFQQWHGYRLAWGDAQPEDAHAAYPNGRDTRWTLYRLINGQTRVLLQGELPENWWDLEIEERQILAEERIADMEKEDPKSVASVA